MAMPAARAISGLLIAFSEPESAPYLFIVPLCFTISRNGSLIACNYLIFKGSKNLRLRLVSSTSPRYLLNSLFSMASKNLRYRSICASLWALRVYPYREYNLKAQCVWEDISYL